MDNNGEPTSAQATTGDIVAQAGRYFRNTRYIIIVGLIGMGLWFAYDGWITYPRENATARAQGKDIMPHPGKDIPLQRALGFVLPPLGIILLIRWLYLSRGEYRLSGQTLHVPGHPPVPFEMISAIDKRLWDRKGIAYIDYEVNGAHGRLKLDDFVYEREPTDQIYDAIVKFVAPPEEQPAQESALETKSPES